MTAVSSGSQGVLVQSDESAVNTVMRGGAASQDLACGPLAAAVLTNDDFVTTSPMCSLVSSTGRVMSGLAFRDDPTDLRQAAESTTIDAGHPSDIEEGELDLNGNLREVGDAPDIGAYEHVPAPGSTRGGRGDDRRGDDQAGGRDQRRAHHRHPPLRHRAG